MSDDVLAAREAADRLRAEADEIGRELGALLALTPWWFRWSVRGQMAVLRTYDRLWVWWHRR